MPWCSGIVCSARDGNLRFTIHFYNHESDVERLADALRAAGGAR
jgi:selenocysteine lyase/cysteine desulfurase